MPFRNLWFNPKPTRQLDNEGDENVSEWYLTVFLSQNVPFISLSRLEFPVMSLNVVLLNSNC